MDVSELLIDNSYAFQQKRDTWVKNAKPHE